MTPRTDEPDYQLVWPRDLFKAETAKLLNQRGVYDWNDRCEQLLDDAFVSGYAGGPLSEFREIDIRASSHAASRPTASLTTKQLFLRDLMGWADQLHEDAPPRRPYWRERNAEPRERAGITSEAVMREALGLINELEDAGYFEKRFGKDCVDDSYDGTPERILERELSTPIQWPLDRERLIADLDLFFDVLELLHDLAARPLQRSLHSYGECGWHHSSFDIGSGRVVYRWRMNKILERSGIGLRLADDGDDAGRLVTVTSDTRMMLVRAAEHRQSNEADDQVRHALALFRARGADRHQKRSAVAALALVLEERRHGVLVDALASTDRGKLFEIANGFHIRHQDAKQQRDYDDFYLDWIFWLYLSTVELTNRIIDTQADQSRARS